MPVNVAGPSNDIETGDIAAGAVTIPKLSFDPGTQAELEAAIAAYIAAVEAHRADTTVVHGIADTGAVVLTNSATLGFYNAAAVAQAGFIAAPTAPAVIYLQAEAAAMKTAVDAIRTVLINLGLTAAA